MSTNVMTQIHALLEDCVLRTVSRLSAEDTHRPFHTALLTNEVVFWSRFERSFSTSFGQSVIEKISRLVALGSGATVAETQHDTHVTLTTVQWEAIEDIVRSSRVAGNLYLPNWQNDLGKVLQAGAYGSPDTRRVRSDLYWVKDGIENYMSIKTVKPNIDQTAEAKRDLLKLGGEDSTRNVYFGLYYNPYGESRSTYSWTPPLRVFDFLNDEPVLIGRDYWDTLGGPGTYEKVLSVAEQVGAQTKLIIEKYALTK
ncbi:TdeIII family type II restriction endonuclease [Arthrobacter crystallopoietes]|uniref:TdeIII family type II restriction endonuclease n=1 Tax=Crystallibacter crystallopoietes TaxID=37928 RepID=UPI001ABDDBDC|nr:TdeIII family type II restriction endonuclease [Arthrobacter crystallopoietes]QTG82586.1 TdeIII family type II restriction endonuclease [Arthrobacter crystallopoietes]